MKKEIAYTLYGVGGLTLLYLGWKQVQQYIAKKTAQNGEQPQVGGAGYVGEKTIVIQQPALIPVKKPGTVSIPRVPVYQGRKPLNPAVNNVAVVAPPPGNDVSFEGTQFLN